MGARPFFRPRSSLVTCGSGARSPGGYCCTLVRGGFQVARCTAEQAEKGVRLTAILMQVSCCAMLPDAVAACVCFPRATAGIDSQIDRVRTGPTRDRGQQFARRLT